MSYKNKKILKAYKRKRYLENKDLCKRQALISLRKRRKRNRDYINKYLQKHPCIDYNIKDIRVLEFDHVRSKKIHTINFMIHAPSTLKVLIKEIEKCDIRCANCHRIKTRTK